MYQEAAIQNLWMFGRDEENSLLGAIGVGVEETFRNFNDRLIGE